MRIAVFNTFDITPAENGGEIRMLNLYRRLSMTDDVRVVSYGLRCTKPVRRDRLHPALDIIDTAVTEYDWSVFNEANDRLGLYAHDILCAEAYAFSSQFLRQVEEALDWADVVIVTHPFLAPEIFRRCRPHQLRIFEALNVELRAKTQYLAIARDRAFADRMIATTRRCEAFALEAADIVLTVSDEDSQGFVEDYAVDMAKLRLVPNGVTVASYDSISDAAVAEFRERAGVVAHDVGVFLGSGYGPNVDSYRLARAWLDEAGFTGHVFIIGRIADVYDDSWPRVGFTEHWFGFVDDITKYLMVVSADFALQIVTSGGGTNLKLFDYMAAATPILANSFGRRGVADDGWFIPVETPADMRAAVATRAWRGPIAEDAARTARAIALREFDWDNIANVYKAIIG